MDEYTKVRDSILISMKKYQIRSRKTLLKTYQLPKFRKRYAGMASKVKKEIQTLIDEIQGLGGNV